MQESEKGRPVSGGSWDWAHAPEKLWERRAVPVWNVVLGAVLLVPGLASMALGSRYLPLYLLFYVSAAVLLCLGAVHLGRPFLRREGDELVAIRGGLVPQQVRVPYTGVRRVTVQAAYGTREKSIFLRYEVALELAGGGVLKLGEKHLTRQVAGLAAQYLPAQRELVPAKPRGRLVRGYLALVVGLTAFGVLGLFLNQLVF